MDGFRLLSLFYNSPEKLVPLEISMDYRLLFREVSCLVLVGRLLSRDG